MATYEYRCDRDGVFEVTRPLGTAPESVTCPVCSIEAKRVISLPMVRCGSRSGWSTAIENAEKSRSNRGDAGNSGNESTSISNIPWIQSRAFQLSVLSPAFLRALRDDVLRLSGPSTLPSSAARP